MSGSDADGSVARVREALLAAGASGNNRDLPGRHPYRRGRGGGGGLHVAQIAKSMIFRAGDRPA